MAVQRSSCLFGDTDTAVTDCHSEHVLLWSNADLAHVICPAVVKQPRMNCFDDLFVPTDMVQFSIQFSFAQSMPHSGSDSRLWIQQVCAFTHRLLAALRVPPSLPPPFNLCLHD